jgi:predicted MPP superfamily phosphohydrolase
MPSYFLIFIAIAEIVMFIGHYIVYKAVELGFNIHGKHLVWTLRYLLSLLSLSFISVSIYTRYANNVLSRFFYRLAATWMGFFVYFFPAAIIVLLIYSYSIILSAGIFFSLTLYAAVLFAVACILGIYGLINAQHLVIKTINLKLPNLPEYWKGKRVIFLSDTHFGQSRNLGLARSIVKKINGLSPDLVLHGGDFFDGVTIDFSATATEFAKIKSTHGIFFATGNHESFEDDSIYSEPLKKAGITVLNNEMRDIEGLNIVGAEYSKTETKDQFSAFLSDCNLDPSKLNILIKHVPTEIEIAEKAGITLMLSGHTHRGQLWPFRYITKKLFKGFDYGLKKYASMNVYTSSGAGTWGPPLRTFTSAEIVLFTLE